MEKTLEKRADWKSLLIAPLKVIGWAMKDRPVGKLFGVPILLGGEVIVAYLGISISFFVMALRAIDSGMPLLLHVLLSFLASFGVTALYGVILEGSILFHEFSHVLVARKNGVNTKQIKLSIIGGAAQMESNKNFCDHKVELPIALAGPASSAFLAGIAAITMFASGMGGPLEFMRVLNVTLAIFNLVPAYPMDGGRILRAILGRKLDPYQSTVTAQIVGLVFFVAFIPVGIFTGYKMLPFIAIILGSFTIVDLIGVKKAYKKRLTLSGVALEYLSHFREAERSKGVLGLIQKMEQESYQAYSFDVTCETLAVLTDNADRYDFRGCESCLLNDRKCMRYDHSMEKLRKQP